MNISLGEFERRHGIAKGTVSKQARAMGFQTSQGLTPAAYAALADHYRVATTDSSAITPTIPQQAAPMTLRSGGLVPSGEFLPTIPAAGFDAAAYGADKQALQQQSQHQAAALNHAITAYAQSRIAGVLADVDLAAESLRANALGAMGLTTGKHQSGGGGCE